MAGPRIAIVIDDLGYHRQRGEAVVDLPVGVSCAIIPSAPHARHLAARAASRDREILVHMPMEGVSHGRLDPGGIGLGMPQQDVVSRVRDALAALPEARGLNNHMGSGITAHRETMEWVMGTLAERKVFFLDSRTTPSSLAEEVARKHGLVAGGRDVFLDNERDLHRINTQFNELLRIARRRGYAIAIGHPYPETIAYLQQVLPLLDEAGIEVVPVSALLRAPAVEEDELMIVDDAEPAEADGSATARDDPDRLVLPAALPPAGRPAGTEAEQASGERLAHRRPDPHSVTGEPD